MPRNGFFGVKNVYIAVMTDEDTFTYSKPVHIPGTVEVKMGLITSQFDTAPKLHHAAGFP